MTDPKEIEKMLTDLNRIRQTNLTLIDVIRQTIDNLVNEADALRQVLDNDYPIILKDAADASNWFSEQHANHGCDGP